MPRPTWPQSTEPSKSGNSLSTAILPDKTEADKLAQLPIKTLLGLPAAKKALADWPWNGRRRTFCTFHVAKHQSADKTALILRHRGEATTLHNSYRGLGITEEQGRQYFEILPQPIKKPIRPRLYPKGIVKIQENGLLCCA